MPKKPDYPRDPGIPTSCRKTPAELAREGGPLLVNVDGMMTRASEAKQLKKGKGDR